MVNTLNFQKGLIQPAGRAHSWSGLNVQSPVQADPTKANEAMAHSRPTLVSLARELGVSRQTVSNVLNAPELVRPETRLRVQEAIDRSGYCPSIAGRALRTSRSHTIALRAYPVIDDINSTVMDRFLHALTVAAQGEGYRITLISAADDAAEAAEIESLSSIHSIDACILTSTTFDDVRPGLLMASGTPFIAFGRPWSSLPGTHSWVDVDGSAGTAAATQHLIGRGHQRIGFVGWETGSGTGDDRYWGWRRTVEVDDADELAIRVADGVRNGSDAAAILRRRGATALVCASDSLALGALRHFAQTGTPFVPVIGFDDTPVARALGVSSVAQPVEEAARICISTLANQLSTTDAPAPVVQQLIVPRLMIRERGGA